MKSGRQHLPLIIFSFDVPWSVWSHFFWGSNTCWQLINLNSWQRTRWSGKRKCKSNDMWLFYGWYCQERVVGGGCDSTRNVGHCNYTWMLWWPCKKGTVRQSQYREAGDLLTVPERINRGGIIMLAPKWGTVVILNGAHLGLICEKLLHMRWTHRHWMD